MGENQIKIVRSNDDNKTLKKLSKKEIRKSSEGKSLVAFSTLGCHEVN